MANRNKDDIDRIVETVIYLQAESRRLAQGQCARFGITATQLNVLKLLQEIGDLNLSELSRRLASKNSTLTGIIDRMVAAELVLREQCQDDRRVWRISLAAKGREIAESIEVAPWDLLRSALNSLAEPERAQLIHTLKTLANHVEQEVARSRAEHSNQQKKIKEHPV